MSVVVTNARLKKSRGKVSSFDCFVGVVFDCCCCFVGVEFVVVVVGIIEVFDVVLDDFVGDGVVVMFGGSSSIAGENDAIGIATIAAVVVVAVVVDNAVVVAAAAVGDGGVCCCLTEIVRAFASGFAGTVKEKSSFAVSLEEDSTILNSGCFIVKAARFFDG